MNILHKIKIDLSRRQQPERIDVVQGDSMSRSIEIKLYDNGVAYQVPDTVSILQIAYCKPDKTCGLYDELPSGEVACAVVGNTVTAILHPQMFTAAGTVYCELRMINGPDKQLTTFKWIMNVSESVVNKMNSEDYYNFRAVSILLINGNTPDDKGELHLAAEDIPACPANIPGFEGSVDDALDELAAHLFERPLSGWENALSNFGDADLRGLPVMDPDAEQGYSPMQVEKGEREVEGEILCVPTVGRIAELLQEFKDDMGLGGLDFDSGYVDEEGFLHLTLGGVEIEGFEPFYIGSASEAPGDLVLEGDRLYLSKDGQPMGEGVTLPAGGTGGSGTGSTMKLLNRNPNTSFSVMDTASEALILYSWSSVDSEDGSPTGKGSASWFVGEKRVAAQTVDQGEGQFDILPYLEAGVANTVKLTIEDAYGTSRSRIWTVTVISFGLSWNLGQMDSHPSAPMTLRLVPTGMGEKILRIFLDGQEHVSQVVASTGRTVTVDLPALSHGAHRISATLELVAEGETVSTEPLTHVGIWYEEGKDTPVVAFFDTAVEVPQYATVSLPYLVYDPMIENAGITLYEKGTVLRSLTVSRGMQNWAYRPTAEGETILKIAITGEPEVQSTLPVTVTDIGYQIAPVRGGLLMECSPAGHSNTESNREEFGYTDGQGANHPFTYSEGFDWVNGGFRQDEEGVTALVIKRGSSVTLDRSLFQGDAAASGKEIKLILKVTNCRDYEAQFLSCFHEPVGLILKAQEGILSSESQSIRIPYCEEEKLELDLNIESSKENRLAAVWLSGIPSGVFAYASTDSWAQGTPRPLTIGSADCDVWLYGLRLYGNSLTRQDILANYIADAGTTEDMIARYERNDIYAANGTLSLSKLRDNNPELRILHISAGDMTTGKSHEVSCSVDLSHKNGRGFSATGVVMKAQGTSSLEYGLAALNLDLDFSSANWTDDKGERLTAFSMAEGSIPVNYFNIKLNVASSENANNVCLAEEYNSFNPYRSMPRRETPAIRDTVEGHACAVFLTNTARNAMTVGARTLLPGETMLYGCGDMNNSKKNFAVFGQDNSLYPKQCCIEILNNNNAPCRFKSDDLTTETWDGKEGTSNFEFRYPKSPTQEMKDAFQALLTWVVSTDPAQATGTTLSRPVRYGSVTYNADSADYRRAKFKAELAEYFAVDSLLFHYLFTEYHLMVDNRAKNTFLSYEWDPDAGGYRWNLNKDYDNDTAAGTDNSGGLSFHYGMEDIDSVGAQKVFNASDSVLWCNLRELFPEELKTMYHSLESRKAWDRDRILDRFARYQAARPEILVAEDMWAKYYAPYINAGEKRYLEMAQGNKTRQRAAFYRYRQPYMSSKYDSPYALSDSLSLRANQVSDLSMTLYSDAYAHVRFGNAGSVKVRGKRGEVIAIPCRADTANDLETYLYSAGSISRLGDLSGLMADQIELNSAVKLRNLPLGSGEPGYENRDLEQLSFGTITGLETMDLRGLTNLGGTLDLSQFDGLRELLATGSEISGVIFAPNAPVEMAELPPVGTLILRGQRKLAALSLNPSKLRNLRVEDSPGVDTLSLCRGAPELQRGRLTGVNWHNADADLLLRLGGLTGYDEEGKATESFVLTGTAHVPAICDDELAVLHEVFPNLEVTFDEKVPAFTVTFQNEDGTVLYRQTVRQGGTAVYQGPTPTKEPTVGEVFVFAGWDFPLTNIPGNLVLTALYTSVTRQYTVRWFDGARLLQTDTVSAYDAVSYRGGELSSTEQDVIWIGWNKADSELESVIKDMDVYSVYMSALEQVTPKGDYDYLYSDDPEDKGGYTLREFYSIITKGIAKDYFQIGDKVKLKLHSSVVTDTEIVLQVYGFRQYPIGGGEGEFAEVVFGMIGVLDQTMSMMSSNNNTGGWKASKIREFLNTSLYPTLPVHWRGMIKEVEVLSSAGGQSGSILMTEDRLFLFSYRELFAVDAQPYTQEVANLDAVPYAIFTDHDSRIKKKYNGGGTASSYWTRSPESSTSDRYEKVGTTGNTDSWANLYAGIASGISFGFCI